MKPEITDEEDFDRRSKRRRYGGLNEWNPLTVDTVTRIGPKTVTTSTRHSHSWFEGKNCDNCGETGNPWSEQINSICKVEE